MKNIFLLLLFIGFFFEGLAQYTFEKVFYPGSNTDTQYIVAQSTDSGAGFTFTMNYDDFGICEYGFRFTYCNEHGQPKWSRNYATGSSSLTAMTNAYDGGYYLTGYSDTNCFDNQVFLIKTNKIGITQWMHLFADSAQYNWWNGYLHPLKDSGLITANYFNTGGKDRIRFTRLTKTGSVVQKNYLIQISNQIKFLRSYNNTFYCIQNNVGQTNKISTITHLSEFADSLASYTLDSNGISLIYDLVESKERDIILLGYKKDSTGNTYTPCIQKIDSTGNTIWFRLYPQMIHFSFRCMTSLADSGFIIAGDSITNSIYTNKGFLFKINSAGDSVYTKVLTNYLGPLITNISVTGDNLLLASGGYDYGYILKTTLNGELLSEQNSNFNSSNTLFEIFPNPVTDHLQINYFGNSMAQLTILNLEGKVVKSESLSPNSGNITINTSQLVPSIYICELRSEQTLYTIRKKMVVINR